MKKIVAFIFVMLMSIGAHAFAVAEVPKSSVWFEPSDAKAGESIQLNALVYNNQTVDAKVTVVFSNSAGTIGTTSATVTKATAKTLSVSWKMPAKSTVVTAKVTAAVNGANKSLPALIGELGTVTVGATAPLITTPDFSFPGSAKIKAWFGPLFTKIDAWRVEQRDNFQELKAYSQKKVDVKVDATDKNAASKALGNPVDYLVLAYASAGYTLFASQALFYIAAALLLLLILRAIVNRFT
jgi:hypothetical protein